MSENEKRKPDYAVDHYRRDLFPPFLDLFDDNFFKRGHEDVMRTDIKDAGDKFILNIEIPGIDKKDIKIALEDGELTITASFDRNEKEEDEEGKYIHFERASGTFSRTFFVGRDVKKADIKASTDNGVLKILIPKKEKEEAVEDKYIAID